MAEFELIGVKIENLRGYNEADLTLRKTTSVIVGPNNSGKTSILSLLDWVFNKISINELNPKKQLTESEEKLVLPARDAGRSARRLILETKFDDRRVGRKFDCDKNGIAKLRFNIRLNPQTFVYLALGDPTISESSESDSDAIELLERIREQFNFVHIPSFRDARSERFKETLDLALEDRIERRALHEQQGGAPGEHRSVKRSLEDLESTILKLAEPLWDEMSEKLPPGMADNAQVNLDCQQSELLAFLESNLSLTVQTGEHDKETVPMDELGSGLQSLLDLSITETELSEDKQTILAIEEPEAFLHPSAQRVIAQRLLDNEFIDQRIITTHSPIIVEESEFGEVILCKNHKFYEPDEVESKKREEINTALLSGRGSEMLFAESVLLVEGESDRQFFERIRRRLAAKDDTGRINLCFVIPVGGNEGFAPWIRMIKSYYRQQIRPINWTVAPDGDSSKEMRRAFKDSDVTVPQELLDILGEISSAKSSDDYQLWERKVHEFNNVARDLDFNAHFLSLDLEEAALKDTTQDFREDLIEKMESNPDSSYEEFLDHLGSKRFSDSGGGNKNTWIRGYIGENIALENLTDNVINCLKRWLGKVMDSKEVNDLIVN
jgi:predicted ATP-dependent endonuclease of OLD family